MRTARTDFGVVAVGGVVVVAGGRDRPFGGKSLEVSGGARPPPPASAPRLRPALRSVPNRPPPRAASTGGSGRSRAPSNPPLRRPVLAANPQDVEMFDVDTSRWYALPRLHEHRGHLALAATLPCVMEHALPTEPRRGYGIFG